LVVKDFKILFKNLNYPFFSYFITPPKKGKQAEKGKIKEKKNRQK
jgi:hypothetical protein